MTGPRGNIDSILLVAVMALLGVGVVMVYSSSSVVALTSYNDAQFFMRRQILWAALGLVAMLLAMQMDHRVLEDKRVVAALLLVAGLLLVATFVPGIGRAVNGARRWIKAGPLTFQPAELVKLILVVYLSSYLSSRQDRIRDFKKGLVPAFIVIGAFLGMVLAQPDFGTVMAMSVVVVLMLLAGGARLTHLGAVAAALVPFAYVAIAQKAYRLRRITAFLNPWDDPQGAGHQIIQSFLAFGSGGVLGRGLGESRQKMLFLPERHSDFIYAVIGEELGLVGALAVLLLFGVILWRGVRISLHTEGFSRMLALGITVLICVQALINMAVVTGIMPTKGIALPLVSYGGSALLVTLASVGVLLNISKEAA